jgi:serine/threonine-protein kinase
MSASVPDLSSMIGSTLGGKYLLLRVIGRGGMGTVFEAEHVAIGRRFALKALDPEWAKDDVVASRFAREARAASAVDSEHIVSVVDAGAEEGCPFLVMELLRGEDLGSRLRRVGRLPAPDALHIAAQVLRGLAAAHAAGIVHRDLKPDNVLLVERAGDPAFAKIVDFGVSKLEQPGSATTPLALTGRGVILGTPLYMAPEQARGLLDVDRRADLFSLGAILFECVAGRPPHVGESYEQVLLSICTTDAPDVRRFAPAVSPEMAAVIARALARDRAHRFAFAEEMLAAVRVLSPDDPATRPLRGPAPTEHAPTPVSSTGEEHDASGPPRPLTEATWTARSPGAESEPPPDEASEWENRHRTRRARARIVATAIVATVAGAGATIGVLGMQPRAAPWSAFPSGGAPASSASGRAQEGPPVSSGHSAVLVLPEAAAPEFRPAAPLAGSWSSSSTSLTSLPASPSRVAVSPSSRVLPHEGATASASPHPAPPPPRAVPKQSAFDIQREPPP